MPAKPIIRPLNPQFSTGPTTKFPGWSLSLLESASLGRSHRAASPKAKLKAVIDRSKALLGLPEDWIVGIIPGSDTGAVETAMWSLLGPKPVTVLQWENFGNDWAKDAKGELPLDDLTVLSADYGELPNLSAVDWSNDVVFTWNGTTSGVRVPNADWIPGDREGLTICDATSAAFAMPMDFDKLDAVTWSWQKVLGGEAAHGMLALSPSAVERLESHSPRWPVPKVFRLTKSGKLNAGIFSGATINTPSMLAVEDALVGLDWAERVGGLEALHARSARNLDVLKQFVGDSDWAGFLCQDEANLSSTALCLVSTDRRFNALEIDDQKARFKSMQKMLEEEGVALDIGAYRTAPPGLRLWGGGTVESSDLQALTLWLDWAWQTVNADIIPSSQEEEAA